MTKMQMNVRSFVKMRSIYLPKNIKVAGFDYAANMPLPPSGGKLPFPSGFT